VAPLNKLIEGVLNHVPGVVFMRDPTRGGLAGLCADLASRTGLHVRLDENAIPIRPETRHAAEMLGIDPLEVANEGKVVFAVRPTNVEQAMAALTRAGCDAAAVIGAVDGERDGLCELVTKMGGRRIIQKPYGEQLPRIC
jgi:hydrogenase expression/formation protein HypE